MTDGAPTESGPLITIVLRLRGTSSPHHAQALHIQATYVQTGDVAHFCSIEALNDHIERLAKTVANQPIDFSAAEARRRSNHA
jgi:hypothetical protein